MEIHHLHSLRLGFSTKEAEKIASDGVIKYVSKQLSAKNEISEPAFITDGPKNLKELKDYKEKTEKSEKAGVQVDNAAKYINKLGLEWKAFLLERIYNSNYPLREKINLFFQNHFVSTLQTVKIPHWIYQHYKTINDFSLGNYKTLVKEMIYSNAIIRYLDNHQNSKGKINENLARELLELFTLGEGNYTESDIKNVALSLAGLNFGKEKGMYRPMLKDDSDKTIFGQTGNFDANDVVDVIFEQKNTPYFLAEKALKWFFYDNPSNESVEYYGSYLKKQKFELKPFFNHLFVNECQKNPTGTQIKNPLIYFFQIHKDLQLKPNFMLMAFLLKNQSMDIYDQPNVKGWKGGRDWLTTQIYVERKQFIDVVTYGNKKLENQWNKRLEKFDSGKIDWNASLIISNRQSAKTIIKELTDRMIFETNSDMETDLNELLKYDFDPVSTNAQQNILTVYNYLAKTPEFQLI